MLSPETHAFLTELAGRPPVDEALWMEALTHGSIGAARDYQRLEFLGDRVLGLVIAEWLHAAETGNEGRLSQRLNALVSRATCARIARTIKLGSHIRLGKQARDDGGADSDNILGDVMEALIGASFVTHGFDETRGPMSSAGRLGSASIPNRPCRNGAPATGAACPNTAWSTAPAPITRRASPSPFWSTAWVRQRQPPRASRKPKPRPPKPS